MTDPKPFTPSQLAHIAEREAEVKASTQREHQLAWASTTRGSHDQCDEAGVCTTTDPEFCHRYPGVPASKPSDNQDSSSADVGAN